MFPLFGHFSYASHAKNVTGLGGNYRFWKTTQNFIYKFYPNILENEVNLSS